MAAQHSHEPWFEVVWPLGRSAERARAPQPRLTRLETANVGLIWDYLFRGDEIFELVKPELQARYPGIRFVDYPTFGNIHGPNEIEIVHELPSRLAENRVDAVIVATAA